MMIECGVDGWLVYWLVVWLLEKRLGDKHRRLYGCEMAGGGGAGEILMRENFSTRTTKFLWLLWE